MPTPPSLVLDGTQAYGSRTGTINGVTYNFESIRIERPVMYAKDLTTVGKPQRSRITSDVAKMTCTIQRATATQAFPYFGCVYADTFDSNYGVESFVLYPQPFNEDNSATNILKLEFTGDKLINGTSGNPVLVP